MTHAAMLHIWQHAVKRDVAIFATDSPIGLSYAIRMTDRIRGKAAGRKRSPLYLDEWIAAKGTNNNRLAGRIGVHRSTIGKWREAPERLDAHQIGMLANALDCHPDDLRRLPGVMSIDQMMTDADPDVRDDGHGFRPQNDGP